MPIPKLSAPRLLLAILMVAVPTGAAAQEQSSDSADVVAVMEAYHGALQAGDGDAALSLLAADALIAESGGLETREEYASHHLPGDMAFASAVERVSTITSVQVVGDAAWIMATSQTQGTFRDREIDSRGAELMVLRREADGAWRIVAIHWSSRRAG